MDQKIPFTSYDFWAYLSAGFALLFAVDQALGTRLLMREHWTVVQGVLAVSLAYATGHLTAGLSSFLFEKMLVGKLLGNPRDILFGQSKAPTWVQKVIPTYFSPLPIETQQAILQKSQQQNVSKPGEALFWVAHASGRASSSVASRMDNFLNLYGFCRNAALVGFVDAAIFYYSYWQPESPKEHLLWARLSLVFAIGMTFRYLKFFRHFTLEVFTSYAIAKTSDK